MENIENMKYVTAFGSRRLKITYFPTEGGDTRDIAFKKLNRKATDEQIAQFIRAIMELTDGQFATSDITNVHFGTFLDKEDLEDE